MKRFWKAAAVSEESDGWGVALDGKPLRTPAKKPLVVPTRALAEAIAGERAFRAVTGVDFGGDLERREHDDFIALLFAGGGAGRCADGRGLLARQGSPGH